MYLSFISAYHESEGPSRQTSSLLSQPQSLENSLQSATDRRRSLINERPRTSTTTILRSYSSSSFESPDEEDENQESDWDYEDSQSNEKANKED